jgi:hypothetical protein
VKVDMAEGSAEMVVEAKDGRSPPEGPSEIGSGGRENLTTNAQSKREGEGVVKETCGPRRCSTVPE